MDRLPEVEIQLQGFFRPDFVTPERVQMSTDEAAPGMILGGSPRVRVRNARVLQARELSRAGASEASFFQEHGFVLLSHRSAVQDWDVEAASAANEDPSSHLYGPEVERLVRERLFPDRRVEVWQGAPVRRGPGTANPDYALGVHQDFGVSPEDFQEGLEAFTGREIGGAWRARFESPDVLGFVMVDFWRSAGMKGPVRHMPLTICDASSVRPEDLVPLSIEGITPTGCPTNQLGLRYREDQRWFYYPEMTPDEVLAFKNFEFRKGEGAEQAASCFHSAFEHPETPENTEVRQSSEHRVSVFLLAG